MTVIINEFEITPALPTTGSQPGSTAPAASPPAPPAQLTEQETERIINRHLARLTRVRAH